MRNNLPLVSIIIPCRNEEKFIARCLDSVVNQTFPKKRMEVLVVDGRSEDRTKEIVKIFIQKFPFIRLLDNPKKIFASANNIGIKNAKGDFVIFLGAHATYSKNYVEECVKYLLENKNVDSVGGVMKTLPSQDGFIAKAIVLSMGGRFGKGREEQNESKEVDTVFGACYKREIFNKIGIFNENLQGSSDMDFSLRLTRAGGKIHMIPNATSFYYPKSNLRDFFLHNIKDGIWAILPWKITKKPMKFRHYFPLFFILTLPLSIWLYIPTSLYFSFKIALREKDFRYFFVMPLVFATRHIGYGLGSVWGLIKLLF